MSRNEPWVEKYRPTTLDEVAAHKQILDTGKGAVKRLTDQNRLPHLLFYGPPGTGKTSTILAAARQLYGKAFANMTLELNASDDRGIDVVRREIQDFASTKCIFSKSFKLVVLDECDAMTKDAQFALRRVMEKYTRNTRFCLICNYVMKIIPALQSRCMRFRFAPLPKTFVQQRLQHVCEQEQVTLGKGGMEALIALGNGDMRRVLNTLQSAHMAFDEVDGEAVYSCTGEPHPKVIEQILEWLLNSKLEEAHDRVLQVQRSSGLALVDIVRELHPWVLSTSFPRDARISLLQKMSDIEYNLAFGTSEQLQLGALIAAFATVKNTVVMTTKRKADDIAPA